jgi:hypothetical protein
MVLFRVNCPRDPYRNKYISGEVGNKGNVKRPSVTGLQRALTRLYRGISVI